MITREQIRRYIFIWLFLFLLVCLLFLYIIWQNWKAGRVETFPPASIPTYRLLPTEKAVNIYPSVTDVIPTHGTGALEEQDSQEEINRINQAIELRKIVPVRTDQFSLDYDYSSYLFVVILPDPFAENQALFEKWRQENGYGDIPAEKFVYRQY